MLVSCIIHEDNDLAYMIAFETSGSATHDLSYVTDLNGTYVNWVGLSIQAPSGL